MTVSESTLVGISEFLLDYYLRLISISHIFIWPMTAQFHPKQVLGHISHQTVIFLINRLGE